MRKIAILVSGEGRAAERIVKLFNEGNRVHTSLVFVDDSASDMAERLKDEEVTVVHIPDSEWTARSAEVAGKIREEGVRLLVSDNFSLAIPDEVMEATNGEFLRLSSPEAAPKEVVDALEAELRRPKQEEEVIEVKEEDEKPTMESEWADALKIQYTPPKVPGTPPEIPRQDDYSVPPVPNREPESNGYYNRQEFSNQEPRYRNEHHHRDNEPMPSTWLIWSILVTVFCCFIPGIIAIIFSSQVSSKYYAGDLEGAKRASYMAEVWIIVSVVLGVLAATLYLPFMMIS